jgi:hypothetical protein
MPTKLAPFVEALHQALKADGHRPRHERRTARALHVELQALGYEGGYTRLTDYIRPGAMSKARSAPRAPSCR